MAEHGIAGAQHFPVSRFFNGIHMEIPPETGRGWTEALEIDSGLCISLSDYFLNQKTTGSSRCIQTPLQFHILLDGTFDFQFGSTARQKVCAGDIWVWNELNGNILRIQPPNHEICGVTLTIPHHLVESWLSDVSCDASRNLQKLVGFSSPGHGRAGKQIFPLARRLPQTNQVMFMARNLFCFEKNTLYGKLHFESQALEFLCGLLGLDFGKSGNRVTTNWKIKAAVDEAVDILQKEWETPPTISAMARRVGINESYLKNGFRTQVGCTIGEFVRQKRMKKALELIESGHSVLETALFVGYANPSHFASVFRKFHGHLPSYFAREHEEQDG